MHQRFRTRSEVDNARDRAVGVDETQLAGLEELVVGVDVGVGVEGDGELGGGVDDVEGEGVVEERGPGCGAGGGDFCGAVVVVAGNVVGEAGEVGGELGRVWGTGGGHCCGWGEGVWEDGNVGMWDALKVSAGRRVVDFIS